MTYERGPGGGAGLIAAFLVGAGVGVAGFWAFTEWQKTQPTGGLRGDTTMGRTYMDIMGSQPVPRVDVTYAPGPRPYAGRTDVI